MHCARNDCSEPCVYYVMERRYLWVFIQQSKAFNCLRLGVEFTFTPRVVGATTHVNKYRFLLCLVGRSSAINTYQQGFHSTLTVNINRWVYDTPAVCLYGLYWQFHTLLLLLSLCTLDNMYLHAWMLYFYLPIKALFDKKWNLPVEILHVTFNINNYCHLSHICRYKRWM